MLVIHTAMSKYTTNRIRIDEVTSLDVISGRGNFTHVSGEQKKNELYQNLLNRVAVSSYIPLFYCLLMCVPYSNVCHVSVDTRI